MTVLRFDPVRGFENIARRMGEMVGEFDKGISFEIGGYSPRVDIAEDEKKIYVLAELPGVNKEDVKVSISEDDVLSLSGEKKKDPRSEEISEHRTFLRTERNYGEFARSFMLPENLNRDSVQAKFENGVLYITIDKKEPEKPKQHDIPIS